MTCSEFDDVVEALAAGDVPPSPETRAHLETCGRCREAYALAVAIEAALVRQPVPTVPETFNGQVMVRVRRWWWRSEQYLDLAFNLGVALLGLAVVAGLYAVLTVSGMSAVGEDLARVFVQGSMELTARAAPHLGAYVSALLLVVSGVAAWWWAERGLEF
jgi:anti-sigma factor RsiW